MQEDFVSVNFLLIVAILLSIVLVGYNAFLIPSYAPPVVTPIETASQVQEDTEEVKAAYEDEALIVNVNLASSEELQLVPGIGAVTAKNILEYRNKVGVITSLDEMLNVKGIGESTLEKIAPYLTLE